MPRSAGARGKPLRTPVCPHHDWRDDDEEMYFGFRAQRVPPQSVESCHGGIQHETEQVVLPLRENATLVRTQTRCPVAPVPDGP